MKKTIAGLALGLILTAGNAFAGDGIIIGSLVDDGGTRTQSACTSQNGTRDILLESNGHHHHRFHRHNHHGSRRSHRLGPFGSVELQCPWRSSRLGLKIGL